MLQNQTKSCGLQAHLFHFPDGYHLAKADLLALPAAWAKRYQSVPFNEGI